ncbi:ABC transporter ATP-binding protein [Candidatus Woesearchaeota archaeon]|nr:ABC transporter ATP-binding protein [Candidatus Woesearchaeota archaeon]
MVINNNKSRISVKKYNKRYGYSKLFRGLDIEIKDGEFVCIVGPNGCGKSTFIKSIAKLIDYDGKIKTEGSISLVGQNQEEMLLPWLSVKSNIIFPKKEKEVNSQLLTDLIQLANLQNYTNHFPYQLSGGMQQLVLIARSLLHSSDVILLDEPFKSLDFQMAKKMQLKVLELWNIYRPTVLMISHDIDEAIFMADKIIILSEKPARVKKIVDVNLPRNRDMKILTSRRFNRIKKEVINEFANE